MFNRLFTGKSQAYAQALQGLDKRIQVVLKLHEEAEALRKRVARLEIDYRELQDMHNALDALHRKLSGHVHGLRGGRPRKGEGDAQDLDSIPPGDKDALRARVGLRAGVRFTHPEE